MSKIYSFSGDDDFCSGGSFYTNPKETSLFLSLGHHVDVYFPPSKRSRISAPFVFSEVQKKQPSIDVLPDECLFEIFRRLPGAEDRTTCASVSKRWLMLVSNIRSLELSTKTDDVMSEADSEEIEGVGYLTRSLEGKKATDIRLAAIAVGTAGRGGLGKLLIRGNKSTRLTSAGFRAVARGCPSLRVLSVWNVASLGDEELLEIAAECHQLEKLDLCQCPKISDKSLAALTRSCPNLIEVTIESCANIGNGTLQALGEFCPNLKSVSVSNCPLVGDQGITSLFSQAGHVLTKLKLQGLNITDVSLAIVGHYGNAITDLVLTRLQSVTERGFWVMGNGHGLQKLRSLAVTYCLGVTDLGLEAVGRGCPNLKQLSIRACPFLSDNGLVSFMKGCVSLEGLHLEECHRITQVGLFGLLANSKDNLKTLSLKSLFGIKDFNLESPKLSSCNSLRSLSICNCPGFGNSTLSLFGSQCPQIEHLDLTGLEQITDAGLLPLVENSNVGIVKANLSGCSNLTDNAVSALVKIHGSTLELLNLDGCSKISDFCLIAIAEKCLFLNELDISKCRITDFGLKSLVDSNQLNLQILSLSDCNLVSDKSVPVLKKLGRSLLGLNLQNCKGISSRSVDSLVEQLWRCDILS